MKKTILMIAVLLGLASFGIAQTKNVARECVLFELFTGVNCPYCPAAANAVAQLLEEGKPIAPVAYHTNAFSTAAYYTSETNARASYYGINSYPTLKTDGIYSMSGGGGASQTNYNQYLNYYNQRSGVESPFTIELTAEPQSDGTCMAHCVVTQVGDCSATNIKVMMALTQCNINVSWQGMQGLHHVCRDMIPNQLGTTFTGPTMTIDEPFELNWPKGDCYLTAWVQNYSGNKEVYQAVRLSLAMDLDYDMELKNVDKVSENNCSGVIAPNVTVRNVGHFEVNSFDIALYVGGVEVHRETWTGTLPVGESLDYQMLDVNVGDASEVTIMVENPNGHSDEFQADNRRIINYGETPVIDGYVKMQFKTDSNPEETTVQVQDMNTGEIVQEYTFELPKHVYIEEFELLNAGCYRITILDSAGNGLGSGAVYKFESSTGYNLMSGSSSTHFKYRLACELNCDGALEVGEHRTDEVAVIPNPSNGTFELRLDEGVWQVMVFDLAGRMVYRNDQYSNGMISLEGCESGVYLLKASNGSQEILRKVMLY